MSKRKKSVVFFDFLQNGLLFLKGSGGTWSIIMISKEKLGKTEELCTAAVKHERSKK